MARSNLEKVLESGAFAVTGELGPPKNADPGVVREKAKLLKDVVDAVNITDCQTAIVRMSSIAAGTIAMQEGVEPVIQMTCRDRNRIGMQSDLLGAYALGARNLLCLTGDHQKFGNHPQSKNVFDLDSMQLLDMMRDIGEGPTFQCGEEIEGPTADFFIGAAANPFADPFEFRALRLAKKVAAGAKFIQTQIIYNVPKFKQWMGAVRGLGLHEENRAFKPHLTLARVRFAPGADELRRRAETLRDTDFGTQHAEELVVYTSELTPRGAVYTPASKARLGG